MFAFFIIQRERIDGGRERRGEQLRVSEDMLREKGGTATVIRKKKILPVVTGKTIPY